MGCGCGKNRGTSPAAKAAAAVPTSELYEVVDANKRVVLRTRDKAAAKKRAGSTAGAHYRRAGTTTPIND